MIPTGSRSPRMGHTPTSRIIDLPEQCLGDRHGHQHGGGHGHGGQPICGSRQPKRARRLRLETDGTNKVRVIATATNTKVAAIPVGYSPRGLAIGP